MTATTRTDPPATVDSTVRRTLRRPGRSTVLVAAGVLAAVALPFLVDAYTISIASTALVLSTVAISTQLLTGVAGLPSLGQAAYLGVGAYTAALIGTAGLSNGPLQLAAAAIAGTGAAALCAPLVLRTRGVAFLMVTFAVAELARTVASKWASVTGGDEGLHTPPVTAWPGGPRLSADGYVYLYLLGCFLLLAVVVAVLLRTRTALVLYAAADHEPRLGALGHHVTRTLVAGYVTAGAVAGAGGAMLVAAHRYLSPADMNLDTSALALLAAAIGGRSIRGAVAGAVLVVAVRDLAGAETGGHALALLGLAFLVVAYRGPATARLHGCTARRRR
jgi:branched-chain amino acid transport system permease protein